MKFVWSALALFLFLPSLWCGSKPLLLVLDREVYFPVFEQSRVYPYLLEHFSTTSFSDLRSQSAFVEKEPWGIFPVWPYGPEESDLTLKSPPPTAPNSQHWLGTDAQGRDVLARLVYGFRNSLAFSALSVSGIVILGLFLGMVPAALGSRYDFGFQRVLETWLSLPTLYLILILASVFTPSLLGLSLLWGALQSVWFSQYVRAETLRVKEEEYVKAAVQLGLSRTQVIRRHILPNVWSPLFVLLPSLGRLSFGGLAYLDYLGFGLPAPAASIGELIREGTTHLEAWWLSASSLAVMTLTLVALSRWGGRWASRSFLLADRSLGY